MYTQEEFERDIRDHRLEIMNICLDLMSDEEEDPEFPDYFTFIAKNNDTRTFLVFANGVIIDDETGMVSSLLFDYEGGLLGESKRQTLKEFTGGDGWQKVKISDDSWQHLEVGINYKVKGMSGLHEFLGWVDSATLEETYSEDPTTVILLFRDVAVNDEWEAYDYGDTFAWGSGAKPLIIKDAD
jgi:hypothetical protein